MSQVTVKRSLKTLQTRTLTNMRDTIIMKMRNKKVTPEQKQAYLDDIVAIKAIIKERNSEKFG